MEIAGVVCACSSSSLSFTQRRANKLANELALECVRLADMLMLNQRGLSIGH